MSTDRAAEIDRLRQREDATRLHLLTIVTPFRGTLDRFMLLEHGDAATLITCRDCRLTSPLDRGARQPVDVATLADFLRQLDHAEAAWDEDAVPEGSHDGITLIAERATKRDYAITHMLAPRSNTPHMRLLRAWLSAFPAINKALG